MATASLERLLSWMQCPECGASFDFTPSREQPLADGVFGVVSCGTHTYPVVDSIPLIRRSRIDVQDQVTHKVDVQGPSVQELIEKVGRDPLGALVDLVAFPPALPFRLERVEVARRLSALQPARLTLKLRRSSVRARMEQLDTQTAQDWFELCYLRSHHLGDEYYGHYVTRFSQPRYLASLSLTSMLPSDDTPVLDLACGFGHMMYHLGVRSRPAHTVGVDRNFFQLWVARRWIAPSSDFVCADALDSLPFVDDAFSASVCTDAFHLFPAQEASLAELRRCARAGTVILDRIGNGLLEPRDVEWEPAPQGYIDLASGAPCRMVSEGELVEGYLKRRGPQFAAVRAAAEFEDAKWLSLVISDDPRYFVDHGPLDGTPHAEGNLGLNPIYVVSKANGDVRLQFEFPSRWHAFENADMLRYHAGGLTLSREEFDAACTGRETGRTEELVRRFVVIGMPESYLRPTEI